LPYIVLVSEFDDSYFFYRFVPESRRLLWREIPDDATDDEISMLDEADLADESLSWKQKIDKFEEKGSSVRTDTNGMVSRTRHRGMPLAMSEKLKAWVSQFRRLDPRWRILEFFNEVVRVGAHRVENEGIHLENVQPLLRWLSRASVFTVWRPTSFEAIRKMMLGQAVGKGLDIKGKSAKRGKLSGFIPFLQIKENRHKSLVRTLSKAGTIRLFFSCECFHARDTVAVLLEAIAAEMIETVKQAELVLADKDTEPSRREDAKESLLWDMTDPSIVFIDDFAPFCYGIEVPVRLFWEAYVIRQDCSSKPGSQYDNGRPSTPAFQDMNLSALLAKSPKDAPRPVIWQNAKASDPMNPYELLMAYEEKGRVIPVASDFDAFLVGTRGVSFDPSGGALPKEQLSTLKWSLDQINKILKAPKRPESWTNRWLEILYHEIKTGFRPKIPRLGFGDPMSTSIFENAVERLVSDGAVRHGAECFNYYFPQELDEEFLVISDIVGEIPWKYMDAEELQEFLLNRVDEGYAFPMNPKWILCDPGWKIIYDKLLSSERKDIQNTMNIWYPPDSGIREQIEEIYSKNPEGFERGLRAKSASKYIKKRSRKIERGNLPTLA
jgi:hypothetical protein